MPGWAKPEGIVLIEAQWFANRRKVYRGIGHVFEDTWRYFYTPVSLERILNKAGMVAIDRIDLAGHRVGSSRVWDRLITRKNMLSLDISLRLGQRYGTDLERILNPCRQLKAVA